MFNFAKDMPFMESSILQIGDILVSTEIFTEFFCCDYDLCRGACCIVGDSGAPLQEAECEELERAFPAYAPLLTDAARARLSEVGFFEVDRDGDLVTPLLGHSEECVYTRFEKVSGPGSASVVPAGLACFCAIERAHMAGRCRFVKPISCRLYPIRASRLSNGLIALNLHRWDICRCAFEKGRREGIRVYEFLRGPLTDAYGPDFYDALTAAATHLLRR